MAESNQGQPRQDQSNQIVFTVLILLLIVIAGMQTWYIVGIKKQLNTIQSEQAAAQQPEQQTEQQVTEKTETTAETENTTPPADDETAPDQAQQLSRQLRPDTQNLKPADPPSFPDDSFFHHPSYAQTWDPYEEIRRMQRHMERAFNDRPGYYKRPDFQYRFRQELSTPEIDVREDRDQYTVFVNTPGADEKNISVGLEGQRLTIRGRQGYEKQDRDASGRIIFSERRSGKFQRSITLPEPVQQKGLRTHIDNGVLTIIIPKLK